MSTKFFQHLNGTIAYEDQGDGPLVICIPSLGDLRAEYRFLIPRLVAAGFRAVTMDLRGHGESSPRWPDYSVGAVGADILALIHYLDAGPAHIIGTSMAGGAAVWAAAEAPELVSGLVLISPFVRDTMPAWQAKLMFTPLFSGPWGPALWIKYYQTLYPTAKPDDFPQYVARLRASLEQPGRLAALRGMITTSKQASEARLGRVSAPALMLMGSRDPDFKDPQAEANWIAQHLAADVRIVEGAGHYPHAETPEQAADLILPFVQAVQREGKHVA